MTHDALTHFPDPADKHPFALLDDGFDPDFDPAAELDLRSRLDHFLAEFTAHPRPKGPTA